MLARAALGSAVFQWARVGNDTRVIPLLQDALVMLGGSDQRLRVRLLTRSPRGGARRSGARTSAALSARPSSWPAGFDVASLSDALFEAVLGDVVAGRSDDRQAIVHEARGIIKLDDGERLSDAHLMDWSALVERVEQRPVSSSPRSASLNPRSAQPRICG